MTKLKLEVSERTEKLICPWRGYSCTQTHCIENGEIDTKDGICSLCLRGYIWKELHTISEVHH